MNALFVALCRQRGITDPEPEVRFHPTRKWRLDYGWRDVKIGLEVEGGAFAGGRHTRGAGFRADLDEKYNECARLGWVILRVLPEQLCTPATLDLLADVHARRAA